MRPGIRVLLVIGDAAEQQGGPQRFLRDQASLLAARGHDVTIFATDTDGPNEQSAPAQSPSQSMEGGSISWRIFNGSGPYAFAPGMLKALRSAVWATDVVHIHGLFKFPCSAASRLAQRADKPYVVHLHGAANDYHHSQKRWKKAPFERLLLRPDLSRAEATIALTDSEQVQAMKNLGLANTIVIPPPVTSPVDDPTLEQAVSVTHRRFGIARDASVIAFVGRLAEKKGVPLLAESFRDVAAQHPSAHLVLAGDEDADHIGTRVARDLREWALQDRVTFTGHISGGVKRALLVRARVFALPSADESFGLSVAEAMSAGTPVVVTPEVALASVVNDSRAGLVVNRQRRSLASGLCKVLGATDSAAMGRRGAAVVRRDFDPARTTGALEDLYRDLVAGRVVGR